MQTPIRRDGRVASQASNRAWLAPAAAVALVVAALLASSSDTGSAGEASADTGTAMAGPHSDSVLLSRKPIWKAALHGYGPNGFVDRTGTRWS